MPRKKLKTIYLRHCNDRGSVPPFFWSVEVDGVPLPVVDGPKATPESVWTTKENAEDMVIAIALALGIVDTTDAAEWKKHGYRIAIDQPVAGTFKNWPE